MGPVKWLDVDPPPPEGVDPQRLADALQAVAERPGVVGVGWGTPRRRERWVPAARALCVRVRQKLPLWDLDERDRVPKRVGALRTDVIEVGAAAVHSIDAGDPTLPAPGDARGAGCATAVLPGSGARCLVLTAGHAVLPRDPYGRIRRAWHPSQGRPAAGVVPMGAGPTWGACVHGLLSSSDDWALIALDGAPYDAAHPLTGLRPPFDTAWASVGTRLRHWSRYSARQDRTRRGEVVAGPHARVILGLGDGSTNLYEPIYEIRSDTAEAFSQPGDSGSLVFDEQNRAVGWIVGSSGDLALSYVVPVHCTIHSMAYHADFFR